MRALSHLNKYFWHYKWQFVLGFIFIVASNLFGIYAPKLVREAFDLLKESLVAYESGNFDAYEMRLPESIKIIFDAFGLSEERFQNISTKERLAQAASTVALILAGLYLAVSIVKGIFLFFMRQTIIITSRLIEFDLKNEVYGHYQQLSLAFYRRNNTGDLMNRISEDVSKVRMYVGPAIMYTINLVVLMVLAIWAMLAVNVELTLYVLMPLPILSISVYYVSKLINERSEKVQRQQSRLSTMVQEAFSGIRVIKAYNRQKSTQAEFATACNNYKVQQLRLVKVDALFMPAIILLIGLSTIITIYVGGLKAISGEITFGNIAEFVIYVNMLTWPFASVGWVTSLVQQASASQKRINEFIETRPEIVGGNHTPDKISGKIVFDHVYFTYPDSGIEALRGISFEVDRGQTLAIIGRTGSGKSTIANLIVRNYDAVAGQILIDDHGIETFNLNLLRDYMGYVPQDVFLFSDTIGNNIGFSLDRPDMQAEKIRDAAKNAHVLSNIDEFPKGFDTMLGERGINLSGGQKQRVSIARALASDPAIYIFDDCLSAVDTQTEEVILDNLKQITRNSTTVLISHRVSTVKLADLIIVLDQGQIIERGTHRELLKQQGAYAELHEKQLLEEKKEVLK